MRDGLTLFDENGALLQAPQPLWQALRQRDWPALFTFGHALDGSVLPHLLDDRMHTPLQRYLNGSKKEFFAFFDTTLVPNPSVLDA